MERIKDISKMKLQLGSVLMKIHMKNSRIIAPDKKNSSNSPLVDYATVIAMSKEITDLEVGDIVLDFRTTEGFPWRGEQYAVLPRMSIKVAVSPEDFDNKVVDLPKSLKN